MTKQFDFFLTDVDRCAVEIRTGHGEVISFAIHYDAFLREQWHVIAIFDSHGSLAHWHLVDPLSGKGERRVISLDLGASVTYAFDAIRAHWEQWRTRYEQRLEIHG